jgi:hypothetical protein
MARSNSRNGYSYVEGNPVNFTDHSGLCQDSVSGTVLCPIQDVGMFFNKGLTRAFQAGRFIVDHPDAFFNVVGAAGMAVRRNFGQAAVGAVNGVASATIYPILDAIWFGEEWLLSGQAEWGGIRRRITDAAWSGAKRLGISDIRQNPGFQVGNFVGEAVGLVGDVAQVPQLLHGVEKLAKWGWNKAGRAVQAGKHYGQALLQRAGTALRQGWNALDTSIDDLGMAADDLSGSPAGVGLCSFTADTPVAAKDGEKPISEIKVGDEVVAYDEKTGETGHHKVSAVWMHTDPKTVYLIIDGEEIETTPEHPFFTKERGWVAASELKVGEHVRNAEGEYGAIEAVRTVEKSQPMYNLTVEKAHTYFVGDGQWLVHNACPKPSEIWSLESGKRGRKIDEMFGANTGLGDTEGGFRAYDHWNPTTKTATSFKSVDLNSPGYMGKPSDIRRTLRKDLKDIQNFSHDTLPDGTILRNEDILRREMVVFIPPSSSKVYDRQLKVLTRYINKLENLPIPIYVSLATLP